MPQHKQLKIRAIKEAMECLLNKRNLIVTKNTKEPDFENLAMFDRNVFYPQRKKLRDECGSLGHSFGETVNPLTEEAYTVCLACGTRLRRV